MESIGTWYWYAGFAAFVVVAIVVDLIALDNRSGTKVSFRQALAWSAVWVCLALIFNALLWWTLREEFGSEIANDRATE